MSKKLKRGKRRKTLNSKCRPYWLDIKYSITASGQASILFPPTWSTSLMGSTPAYTTTMISPSAATIAISAALPTSMPAGWPPYLGVWNGHTIADRIPTAEFADLKEMKIKSVFKDWHWIKISGTPLRDEMLGWAKDTIPANSYRTRMTGWNYHLQYNYLILKNDTDAIFAKLRWDIK